MKKTALLIALIGLIKSADAQISITSSALTYTQNFDGLDTSSAATNATLPTGWAIAETGTNANQTYRGGNGSSNTGDVYSLGTTGSTERAFGSLASGSLLPNFGAKFTNNTGGTITGFTITYKGEQWRAGGRTTATALDSLVFYYSTTATNVNDTSATAGFVNAAALNFTSLTVPTTAVALDGNLAANRATVTATVPVTLAAGASLVIKWVDPNIVSNDDALGIDSFTAVFTTAGVTPGFRPNIVSVTPADNATGVSPSSNLVITFDRTVTGNAAGNITIKNVTAQTTVTKAGNSADVTVNGKVVTIANAGLVSTAAYFVKIDSAAFDTAGFKSYGIYDSTAWNFSTVPSGISNVTLNNISMTVAGEATSGNIPFIFSMKEAGMVLINITDLSGKVVYRESFKAVTGDQQHTISGLPLAPGLYIIRAGNERNYGAVKFTVK